MENKERKFEAILEAIDNMCAAALQSNDKMYWQETSRNIYILLNVQNQIDNYLYYDFLEAEHTTEKQKSNVQGIADHILRTATSLVNSFDTITPTRGVYDLAKDLMRIRDNIKTELLNLTPAPPAEAQYTDAEKEFILYMGEDGKIKLNIFYERIAPKKGKLKKSDVYNTFFDLLPSNVTTVTSRKEIAELLNSMVKGELEKDLTEGDLQRPLEDYKDYLKEKNNKGR